MKIISREKIVKQRNKLIGKNIELIEDIPSELKLKKGLKGVIFNVDDAGHILVRWENNCRLNILPDVDRGKYIITKSKNK